MQDCIIRSGFVDQYHDHETGLHYNRYRYYDPRVGRFVCKDPINYAGALNLYAYVPNPTGWVDPLGLQNEDLPLGSDKNPFVTSRAARREAMRKARIPTSQQPISQAKTTREGRIVMKLLNRVGVKD